MISYRTILFGTVAVLAAAAPAMATSNIAAPAARPVVRAPQTSNIAAPAARPIARTPLTSNIAAPALVRVIGVGLFQLEEALLGIR
jgi:hypothetical protein